MFIHPSENPRVIAGQGTVSLELLQQVEEMKVKLDAVIIPVGGGGLASGNTVTLRAILGDEVKIILAEPSKMDDAKRSFEAGELLKNSPDNKLDSVADGLKTNLGPNTWPIIRDMVDDILTVNEDEILKATKLVWERLKITIEPSAGGKFLEVTNTLRYIRLASPNDSGPCSWCCSCAFQRLQLKVPVQQRLSKSWDRSLRRKC